MKKVTLVITAELSQMLGITDSADEISVANAIKGMADKLATANTAIAQHTAVVNENTALKSEVASLKAEAVKNEVANLLEDAIKTKRITAQQKEVLNTQYASKPEELKQLLAVMNPFASVTDSLKHDIPEAQAAWTWDDYQKNDPSGKKLRALRENNPNAYKAIFDAKFKQD